MNIVKITQITFGNLKISCAFLIQFDDIQDFRKMVKIYYPNENIYFNYTEKL